MIGWYVVDRLRSKSADQRVLFCLTSIHMGLVIIITREGLGSSQLADHLSNAIKPGPYYVKFSTSLSICLRMLNYFELRGAGKRKNKK